MRAAASEECLACHSDPDLTQEIGSGRVRSLFVDPADLERSPHRLLSCGQCHAGVTDFPHPEPIPLVRCDGCHRGAREALRKSVHGAALRPGGRTPTCVTCHGSHQIQPPAGFTVQGCQGCHAGAVRQYQSSVHAGLPPLGDTTPPSCQSCHGPAHSILSSSDAASPTYHLNLPRTCAGCHADPALASRVGLRTSDVYKLYMDSIHGRALSRKGLLVAANCSDCHGSHEVRRRTDPAARVHRANIPETCGGCHAGILAVYWESIHGETVKSGGSLAPVCSDCHTAHEIQRVEMDPWKLQIVRECGTCHEPSLATYRDTFHGRVTALGYTLVARCSDCHGSHNIFSRSDPRSTLSTERIVDTCGQCHQGATLSFTQYHPHADHRDKARFPILYYTHRFMALLLWGVLGFFGLHTLLWFPRSLKERMTRRRRPPADAPGETQVLERSETDAGAQRPEDDSISERDANP
jgi:hypothetical protein